MNQKAKNPQKHEYPEEQIEVLPPPKKEDSELLASADSRHDEQHKE